MPTRGGKRFFTLVGRRFLAPKERRQTIDAAPATIKRHEILLVSSRCKPLGVARSTYYCQRKEAVRIRQETLLHGAYRKAWISQPALGSRKIISIAKRHEEEVSRKRVSRLMGVMGVSPLLPKPSTAKVNKSHHKYLYLLKGVKVDHPNHFWCTNITYIP